MLILRALRQLGILPAALNGLYKVGLAAGVFPVHAPRAVRAPLQPIFPPPPISDDPLPEAEEILNGRIRLFGGEPVALRLAPSAPLRPWTAYESLPAAGDIKFIWEPARFGFVFPLGRAFLQSGQTRFAAAFWRFFEEFDSANPPYLGENWMSGQEAGLRLMAFCWAGQIFAPAADSNPQRMRRLSEAVAAHAQRIPPTLLYARAQNNNHLLTEAAALYTAARALPEHPRASQWRRLGKKWLNWCFSHQFDAEGEYIQHSTNYQRLALRTAQWVFEISGGEFDAQLPVLRRAAQWLAARTDPLSGRACNLGANDGANIFPVSSAPGDDFRPLFQPGSPISVELPARPAAWQHLRVKRYRSRPSHADHLHLDLWLNGLYLARDPGTFSYNAPAPWQNSLTTALVHNTLTVDDRDQMTRAGRFLYLDWGTSRWLDDFTAESDAYARLGLIHRRKVETLPAGWRVRDEALFTRPGFSRRLRLHWLLADLPWQFSTRAGGAALTLRTPFGALTLEIWADFPLQASLFRAGQSLLGAAPADPTRGWFSPTYAAKIPALSLALTGSCDHSTAFITTFALKAEG